MSKAPSKAPSQEPGTTSMAVHPSRVPLPPSQAPTMTPSSRIPSQEHTTTPRATPRLTTIYRPSPISPPPALTTTAPSPYSFRTSAIPGPSSAIPEETPAPTATAATIPSAIPKPSTTMVPGSAGTASLKSVYRNPEDLRRAQLQTTYKTLTPAERAEQDAWAKRKADEFAPCPFNFAWERDDYYPGYRCAGGAHYMSDAILAEGVPGLYARQGCHTGLKNWDRKPPELEGVPPEMYGPVRPIGVDKKGKYTYFEGAIDWPLTLKRSQTEPLFNRW